MSYKDIMLVTKDAMEDVADAIRTKTGGTDPIKVEDLDDAVDSIETGVTPTGTIQINQNGQGIDVTNYAAADVNVPVPAYGFIVKCTHDSSDYLEDNTEWTNPVLSTDSELEDYSVGDNVIITGYASGDGGNTYFVAYGYITEKVTGGIKFFCIRRRTVASLS